MTTGLTDENRALVEREWPQLLMDSSRALTRHPSGERLNALLNASREEAKASERTRAETAEAALAIKEERLSQVEAYAKDHDALLIAAEARAEKAEGERDELNKRNVKLNMLAYKWMEAHDRLQAGRPYDFPAPADVPDAIARAEAAESTAQALREELERARGALEHLTDAKRHFIISGSSGPLYSAGWAAACNHFAEAARQALSPGKQPSTVEGEGRK